MKEAWQAVIKHNAASKEVEAASRRAEWTADAQDGSEENYGAAGVGEAHFA
jgi:hypothetical protein